MRWVHTALTVILGLAVVVMVIRSEKKQRNSTQELRELTDANEVLKKTLGELTIAITEKEKQIDELLQRSCKEPAETTPRLPPPRAKPWFAGRMGAD